MPYRVNRRKVDSNHVAMVEAARGVGATVISTASLGRGNPDLVVLFRGRGYLIECKGPGGELTPAEKRFALFSREPVHVVRSVDELLSLIGAVAYYAGSLP